MQQPFAFAARLSTGEIGREPRGQATPQEGLRLNAAFLGITQPGLRAYVIRVAEALAQLDSAGELDGDVPSAPHGI